MNQQGYHVFLAFQLWPADFQVRVIVAVCAPQSRFFLEVHSTFP